MFSDKPPVDLIIMAPALDRTRMIMSLPYKLDRIIVDLHVAISFIIQ